VTADETEPTSTPEPDSTDVQRELDAALMADTSTLGDVWRLLAEGKTPPEIATQLGANTTGFVASYRSHAEVVLGRRAPREAPTMAMGASRVIQRLIKNNTFSLETVAYLAELRARLDGFATNDHGRAREELVAREETAAAEQTDAAGVYVYSLPHYLRYPYDPDSGHTLFKVGHSAHSATKRFIEQTRTTALPEDPILLRIYRSDDSAALETQMHMLLSAADHSRSAARMGGTEWFLTTTRFLDAIAGVLSVEVQVVPNFGEGT
jgi:hypothetical protein